MANTDLVSSTDAAEAFGRYKDELNNSKEPEVPVTDVIDQVKLQSYFLTKGKYDHDYYEVIDTDGTYYRFILAIDDNGYPKGIFMTISNESIKK